MTTARREFAGPATVQEESAAPVWQLQVLGKRKRLRMVPVSAGGVDALRVHWRDRGLDFDNASEGPLRKLATTTLTRSGTPSAPRPWRTTCRST